MLFSDIIFPLSLAVATVSAGVVDCRATFTLPGQNVHDAQQLNQQFQGLTASSKCMTGETVHISDQLAQCVGDTSVINNKGTTYGVTYDTPQGVEATGAEGGKRDDCEGRPTLPIFWTLARAETAPLTYEAKAKRADTSEDLISPSVTTGTTDSV